MSIRIPAKDGDLTKDKECGQTVQPKRVRYEQKVQKRAIPRGLDTKTGLLTGCKL